MAVGEHLDVIESFEDWYDRYDVDSDGCLIVRNFSPFANELWSRFENFKREHSKRVENYWKYEVMADAEVVSTKPDLPNVSSGEIAGMIRRIARNVVQHTPNVEIICEFDDDSPKGILARHILMSKIIGEELNSNEMQQNLFASVCAAATLGFEAVVPRLTQRPDKTWVMEYDTIHYRDVFPEPGIKDARKSPEFFVRRYLTRGDVAMLLRHPVAGWDQAALRRLYKDRPPAQQMESVSHQNKKHHTIPDGYEIITWYSRYGDSFLTFDARSKMLLRIEKNKDPLLRLPVHVLILEKDHQQPLGKSQIALVYGRQEFQDLMLNGAMKLWYRNINPTIFGYGTGVNGALNMSPGKFQNIPNPQARIEAFEVNTQTLLQYGSIAQQNQGAMVNLIGAADQQMAAQAGNGMSATPQGVEAQQQMVDITTNNYQKSVEHFFSQYCSYALTLYFAELRNEKKIKPTADVRQQLIGAGIPPEMFDEEGVLAIKPEEMATVYYVKCVPGSLVELEDEKQIRVLNDLFIPLSQGMGAIAQTGDQMMIRNAVAALQFIIAKQIELSGSKHAGELKQIFTEGPTQQQVDFTAKVEQLETGVGDLVGTLSASTDAQAQMMLQMQEQIRLMQEQQTLLMQKLGVIPQASAASEAAPTTLS